MKNLPMLPNTRNRERGAVAMMVAVMWTVLFGMAVLAVDFGYLYTKRRNIQAAADSAVRAAMPVYDPLNPSAANSRAINMANANGYTTGVTTTPNGLEYSVSIAVNHPTFFGSLFGIGTRSVSGAAAGRLNAAPSTGAAIMATAPSVCAASPTWGVGIYIQGDRVLNITGDVVSNGQAFMMPLMPGSSVTGTVKTACAPQPAAAYNPRSVPETGGESAAGNPWPDPLPTVALAALNAFCTKGTSIYAPMATGPAGPLQWTNVGPCDTITNDVYCSSIDIAVAPTASNSICPGTRATFISQGRITFGASGTLNLQPYSGGAGPPDNAIAISTYATANCGTQAINMGTSSMFNVTGNAHAPSGCINIGGGDAGMTWAGSIVGAHLNFGMSNIAGLPWTIGGGGPGPGPGPGPGGNWKMIR
ncbi:MAG TPA: pilus assembly protein TadG-related protein [Polyangia bacterium]